MKKLALLLAAFAILLTACSGISTINPNRLQLDKAYKLTANIQYGNNAAVANFTRSAANVWEIAFLEPFAMEGMVLTYLDGRVSMELKGQNTGTFVADDAVFTMIIAAFEHALTGEGREAIAVGEEIKLNSRAGGSANKPYEMVLNRKSHEPISLKLPTMRVIVDFSSVTVSQIVPVILQDSERVAGVIPHDY